MVVGTQCMDMQSNGQTEREAQPEQARVDTPALQPFVPTVAAGGAAGGAAAGGAAGAGWGGWGGGRTRCITHTRHALQTCATERCQRG
eukprot:357500-Chlamydomonas_euryale.AAC.14